MGAYAEVGEAVTGGIEEMLLTGKDPAAALADAAAEANEAIQSYDSGVQ
jgi:hypothetical protein